MNSFADLGRGSTLAVVTSFAMAFPVTVAFPVEWARPVTDSTCTDALGTKAGSIVAVVA